MKKIVWPCVLAAVITVLGMASTLPGHAAEGQTLPGEYYWDQGSTGGTLEAVFTPTGEGMWDVAFHFTFDGEKHTYTGTAQGSLTDGSLKGEVKADKRPAKFTFEGTVTAGKFSGTHAQVRENGQVRTGTLTLGE